LALKVEAGADDQSFEGNSMFTLFSINVTLTEEGYTKLEEVLEAIFSFLLLLKSTPIEEHEKCFMELKQIRDTSFKFREEKTSNENVEEHEVLQATRHHRRFGRFLRVRRRADESID
jgi:nardilysin